MSPLEEPFVTSTLGCALNALAIEALCACMFLAAPALLGGLRKAQLLFLVVRGRTLTCKVAMGLELAACNFDPETLHL